MRRNDEAALRRPRLSRCEAVQSAAATLAGGAAFW